MKTLFPIAPEAVAAQDSLELYRDIKWDYTNDKPVWVGGEPVWVTGAEAVTVWCYHALRWARYRNLSRSAGYGAELDRLIGLSWSEDVKRAETARLITEALTVSPYVSAVSVSNISFAGGVLSAQLTIMTIYGEVSQYV